MNLKKLSILLIQLFKKTESIPIPKDIRGTHDCGLRALHVCCPDLSIQEMRQGFLYSSDGNWPYAGLTNKEFNIALTYLRVDNRFDYNDDRITVFNLVSKKRDTFIALILGHYIVIKKGKILDGTTIYQESDRSKRSTVYCYWRLNGNI